MCLEGERGRHFAGFSLAWAYFMIKEKKIKQYKLVFR